MEKDGEDRIEAVIGQNFEAFVTIAAHRILYFFQDVLQLGLLQSANVCTILDVKDVGLHGLVTQFEVVRWELEFNRHSITAVVAEVARSFHFLG